EFNSDPVAQAELNLATRKCVRDGLNWNDDNFVPAIKRYLNGHANGGAVQPRPAPAPQPQRQAPVQRQAPAIPYSAPPTRDGPSMSTGRPLYRSGPLNADEKEVAASMAETLGITQAEAEKRYMEQKEALRRQKLIGNGNG